MYQECNLITASKMDAIFKDHFHKLKKVRKIKSLRGFGKMSMVEWIRDTVPVKLAFFTKNVFPLFNYKRLLGVEPNISEKTAKQNNLMDTQSESQVAITWLLREYKPKMGWDLRSRDAKIGIRRY